MDVDVLTSFQFHEVLEQDIMADSTTLITFLVRAPPMTRSVTLKGSWDNFTASYPMKRDGRVGPEHWTGCHSFKNIICDGDLAGNAQKRDGGLKMGGTYWYYVCRHPGIDEK